MGTQNPWLEIGLGFWVKTECVRPSICYDVRSELISFDNVLWQHVEPDRADNKQWWNSFEAEKDVHLGIKVCFKSAKVEDEFMVR